MPMILELKNDDLISAEALPDEHIYSVVSTAYVRSGYQSYERFSADYGIPHFNNRRIYSFFKIFKDPYQVFSHTVYFDLINVLPKEAQRDTIEAIISGEIPQGSFASKLKAGLVQNSGLYGKYPLYCPVCALEDMDIGLKGSPYIRTYHNTGGVTVCPHHGARLKELREPFFKPITVSAEEIEWGEDFEQRIVGTLFNFRGLNKEILDRALYDLLLEGGYIRSSFGIFNRKKLINDLYARYPEDFLADHNVGEESSWVKRLLKKDELTHPFYYALLFDLFGFDSNTLYYYKSPEVRCLNAYCEHSDTEFLYLNSGKKYYRCRNCKMIFTDNNRIIQYGEIFTEGVKRDYVSGMELKEIEKKTRRNRKVHERIISGEIDPFKIDTLLSKHRDIALGFKDTKDLQREKSNTYKYLSWYDRDWLIEHFGDPNDYKGEENNIDTSKIKERIRELDQKYVEKLVSLEESLIRDTRKRTRKFYTDLLSVPKKRIFGEHSTYQKTVSYIDGHTETTEEYHQRIALPVLKDLIGDGLSGDDLRKSFLKTFKYRPWAKALYDEYKK